MHGLAPLIYDLAIMLGVAGIVTVIFQRIHQPVVLGYLVAGIILGPYTPPYAFVRDLPSIQTLSELGVIFLMFSLGLEFSFHKLVKVGFSASITGLVEVVLMTIIGFAIGKLLGWSYYNSLFLGAALSISSTTIIIKAIDELGLKTKRFAEIIFGILIIEDLLAILLLVALSTVVLTQNVFSMEMLISAGKLLIVVGGWFLAGYFFVPPLFRQIATYLSEETLTIVSIALCLSLVCVAVYFHYSSALGAFIMGSVLGETILVERIVDLIKPIRDIFAAVFFISVGMLIDPHVIVREWPIIILLSFITIVGKILVTSLVAFLTGQSLYTSIRIGFGMAQIGEFSFIIIALGLSLKVIDKELYPIIVAVSGITTFTTPYLIRLSGYISARLEKNLPMRFRYFLDSYSAWVYRTQTATKKSSLFQKITVRLILNGIIIAILFTLVNHFIAPRLQFIINESWLNNSLGLIFALAISSPFIWGMLFSYRAETIPEYARTGMNPVIFVVWLVTLLEIFLLSLIYFHGWFTIILITTVVALFFFVSYRHLEISYRWFETQLLKNIQNKSIDKRTQYEELAPWDTHLVEIEVGHASPLVDKTLSETNVRQQFGINVVAVYHSAKAVLTPRGDEKIYAHDKLIVLGEDEQIDAFKKHIQSNNDKPLQPIDLHNFVLNAFLIEKDHPLIGKTIRDSKIREYVNGIVVGLERDNIRILNPLPETVIKQDDLLLVVGEVDKMKKM